MEIQSEDLGASRVEEQPSKPLLKKLTLSNAKDCLRNFFSRSKVTWGVLALIWAVFLLELILTATIDPESGTGLTHIGAHTLVKLGANNAFLVKFGQVHRLFVANLLHGHIWHILGNSLGLLIFCRIVEAAFPLKIYLLTLVIGGIQANMFFDLFWRIFGNMFQQLLVGLSTSICAVVGLFVAQVWVLHKSGVSAKKGKVIAVFLLVYLAYVSVQPNVSLLGHLGGLLSGFFLGLMVLPKPKEEEEEEKKLSLEKLKKQGLVTFVVFTVVLFGIWL